MSDIASVIENEFESRREPHADRRSRSLAAWTFGALVNHIWSVAGDDDRADVNQTFMQPFMTYALGHGVSLSANFEATYDWTANELTLPLNLAISKVTKFGHQPVSLQLGGRVYLDGPDDGPEWGIRTVITFLFPKT